MELTIRAAKEGDLETIVSFCLALSQFNRTKHDPRCTQDDYKKVQEAIREKTTNTFLKRSEKDLYLIAELDKKAVGYAYSNIYTEDPDADNGTGQVGLLDELFLLEEARGYGAGQKLIDMSVNWFKEQRIHRVKLFAFAWNKHAHELYIKNGFAPYASLYQKFV